jgi:hypothetical protein
MIFDLGLHAPAPSLSNSITQEGCGSRISLVAENIAQGTRS